MNTVIAQTNKGHRVWLQGIVAKGITAPRFDQSFEGDAIVLKFSDTGKRKVTQAKGGIVDIVGKKVTQWAKGSESATVAVSIDRQSIVIIRD